MQVLTSGFLLYFHRSELQFVWQETMTELRFVWPLNVTGHYFRALTSWPSYLHKKHKKIGIYKMEKPNTKKRYFNYKRENSQPNTSYTTKQINSVYPKKVNSGPAWTRTIGNKLALSKSIMAKHLQIQTTVRRAQGWNSDISKTFQKTQQRFHMH